jgi:O-acetyl-ADP-ribose deacetylase (regulator of RNase III)
MAMFKALIGDLFDSKAQTIVNTVNCVGVMGKGVALEFKTICFDATARKCV